MPIQSSEPLASQIGRLVAIFCSTPVQIKHKAVLRNIMSIDLCPDGNVSAQVLVEGIRPMTCQHIQLLFSVEKELKWTIKVTSSSGLCRVSEKVFLMEDNLPYCLPLYPLCRWGGCVLQGCQCSAVHQRQVHFKTGTNKAISLSNQSVS